MKTTTISRSPTATTSAKSTPQPRVHLAYLDGLRGLAALYVVVFHLWQTLSQQGNLPASFANKIAWMGFGHSSVAIFIVLSGYCLTIPVAKSQDSELSQGFAGYMKRRAFRILPPYFAALGFSLLSLILSAKVAALYHLPWKGEASSFSWPVIMSHLFLVHNLSSAWAMKINPPMWSVAAEWQIYFFLPLILLPIYRRAGLVPLLVVACGLSLVPHFVFHYGDWTAPWYLGLFAFGMAEAFLNFSPRIRSKSQPNLMVCGIITSLLWLVYLGLACVKVHKHADLIGWTFKMSTDFLIGCAAISLIVFCTEWLSQRPSALSAPVALKVLQFPPLVGLGAFSYSLYLIHSAIIGLILLAFSKSHFSPMASFTFTFLGVLPVILGCSYVFHLGFEKPFMRTEIKPAKSV